MPSPNISTPASSAAGPSPASTSTPQPAACSTKLALPASRRSRPGGRATPTTARPTTAQAVARLIASPAPASPNAGAEDGEQRRQQPHLRHQAERESQRQAAEWALPPEAAWPGAATGRGAGGPAAPSGYSPIAAGVTPNQAAGHHPAQPGNQQRHPDGGAGEAAGGDQRRPEWVNSTPPKLAPLKAMDSAAPRRRSNQGATMALIATPLVSAQPSAVSNAAGTICQGAATWPQPPRPRRRQAARCVSLRRARTAGAAPAAA